MRYALLALLVALPAAAEVEGVVDADARMVEGCQFVGPVEGANRSHPALNAASDAARDGARRGALKLGATHVVWNPPQPIVPKGAFASGSAYRCQAGD